VDEGTWLASTHFEKLYSEVKRRHKAAQTKSGRRRLRLLACGTCRCLLWHLPVPDANRQAVEEAEAFADGLAGPEGLAAARAACRYSPLPGVSAYGRQVNDAADAMIGASGERPAAVAFKVVGRAVRALPEHERPDARGLVCGLLRDIFRNPYRPPPALPPGLLERDGGLIARLAEAAYEQRMPDGLLDPHRLGVLADAVEEAGADAEVVGHLRTPGPKVRGLWSLDLLLRKG
jgi:hypothetical protein